MTENPNDRCLVVRAGALDLGAPLGRMHELGLAADERFIDLDLTRESVKLTHYLLVLPHSAHPGLMRLGDSHHRG